MPDLTPKNSSFKTNRFDRRRLIPEKQHKPINIINESLYSKHVPDAEFTNFLNNVNKSDFESWMVDFTNNPDRVFEYTVQDESENVGNEIKELLEATHPDLDLSQVEFIMKTRWVSLLDETTPFRLYFILSSKTETFDLVLIDPMHLSIPSRVQRKNETYKNNKDNTICISKSVQHIKEHLHIKRNNILNTLEIN